VVVELKHIASEVSSLVVIVAVLYLAGLLMVWCSVSPPFIPHCCQMVVANSLHHISHFPMDMPAFS